MRLWSHDKLIVRFLSKSDLTGCSRDSRGGGKWRDGTGNGTGRDGKKIFSISRDFPLLSRFFSSYLVFTFFLPGESILPLYMLFRMSFSSIKGKNQAFWWRWLQFGEDFKEEKRENGEWRENGTGNTSVGGETLRWAGKRDGTGRECLRGKRDGTENGKWTSRREHLGIVMEHVTKNGLQCFLAVSPWSKTIGSFYVIAHGMGESNTKFLGGVYVARKSLFFSILLSYFTYAHLFNQQTHSSTNGPYWPKAVLSVMPLLFFKDLVGIFQTSSVHDFPPLAFEQLRFELDNNAGQTVQNDHCLTYSLSTLYYLHFSRVVIYGQCSSIKLF